MVFHQENGMPFCCRGDAKEWTRFPVSRETCAIEEFKCSCLSGKFCDKERLEMMREVGEDVYSLWGMKM